MNSDSAKQEKVLSDPALSVVVPVYRSEGTLPELHRRLAATLEEIGVSYEILLVDDASPDNSWDVMQRLHEEDARIKIIQLMRNFGQHNATLCGIRHASGKLLATMDDDLQHPPEEIAKLIRRMEEADAPDVVIGAYTTKQHSWWRNLGTNAINAVTSYVFGKEPDLQMTTFRLMRRSVVDVVSQDRSHSPRIGLIILTITKRIVNVPVEHHARKEGRSGYRFGRLVANTLDNIITYSSLPLQVVSILGIVSAIVSLLLAIFYLVKYAVFGISVPGWTTIVMVLLLCSGVLMFSRGVVGEYLVRIMREISSSPRCVIRHREM